MLQMLFLITIIPVVWAQSFYHCTGAPDLDATTTCASSLNDLGTLTNALDSIQPDLRVVSLNQYAWRAKQSQYATIRSWLNEVLKTTDIIAFQEFSEGDFRQVDRYMRRSFNGRTFKRLETSPSNPSLTIYASGATFSSGGMEAYGWDNFDRHKSWADGYERYVLWSDIHIKGKTLKVANNHGCLGSMPDGQCSSFDRRCNRQGSNGKFDNGGCKNSGGRAIIEMLRDRANFFEDEGANSIFFCDCNNFSPPEMLCSEGMQVRGRLNCGGPNLDFIGYGRNLKLLAHYGFGGTASNGDSDHKSVILDFQFADSSVVPPVIPPASATCGNMPSRCVGHIDWAMNTGRSSFPENYPDFEKVTGNALSQATRDDMVLYFYCKDIQESDCNASGLLSPCENGQPRSCELIPITEEPTHVTEDPAPVVEGSCTAGFSNVKLECGGCKVLTQDVSIHPTCNDFCKAQGRACVSAEEEVSNDCNVKYVSTCDKDFRGITSDILCECSASPITTEAFSLGFALSTINMQNPLPNAEVASIVKNAGVKKFRLYGDADPSLVGAVLQDIPDATFMVSIGPSEVNTCADNINACREILERYNSHSNSISYVAIGNEPLKSWTTTIFSKIQTAVVNTASVMRSLGWTSTITVPFSMEILRDTFPVSNAYFVEPTRSSAKGCEFGCTRSTESGTLASLLNAVQTEGGVFAIQVYPYFTAKFDSSLLDLSLDATRMLHQQVASVSVALGKVGFGSMPVIVTEVGWPTAGSGIATMENAQTFLSSLVQAREDPSLELSFSNMEIFAFEFFDESRKGGDPDEVHFGWFTENGQKKFDITSTDVVPVGPQPCTTFIPDSCNDHLKWAMTHGRSSSSASSFYPDFEAQTGVSLADANREDMQRYFVCNDVQNTDCGSMTAPCSCSRPPCGCAQSVGRRLLEILN